MIDFRPFFMSWKDKTLTIIDPNLISLNSFLKPYF